MEYKHQTTRIGRTLVCLLLFLLKVHGTTIHPEPQIISTQDEVITYVNHTAKLSCVIQNRNRRHVTWSRVDFINETQKLTHLLYVDFLKYTSLNRYHLAHIEKDNREYWNLEIRQVHLSDQGYYSCVLTAIKPISKIFYVKVIDNARNPPIALRSTSNMQRLGNGQTNSSLPFLQLPPFSCIFLMIILLLII